MASLFSLIRETIANYNNDNVASWSAALSYYTAFSLTPLLVLTISIVGVLVGEGTAKQEALIQVQKTMGKDAAELASRLLDNASDPGEGLISTVVGMGLLVMGASRIFTQLETSLNTIWKVRTKKNVSLVSRIADKITTFSLVAVGGFLLLVSLIASVAVSVILNYFEHIFPVPDVVSYPINLFIPFFITTIFFALIYKILPEVRLKWKYALLGGSIASFLFTLGQYLLSLYITHSAVVSVYGAAASLLVVLLWVYYSSQILYIGAEFTKSYLHQKNIALIPKNNAEFYSLQTPEKHERKSASVDTAISYFLSSFFVNVLRKSRERGIKKD